MEKDWSLEGTLRENLKEAYSQSSSPSPYQDYSCLQLLHSWDSNDSIISSIVSKVHQWLICGTQNGKILVFDLKSYRLIKVVFEDAMQGSNLCLVLDKNERYLFVGGSESLIKVYDLNAEEIKCIKIIYSTIDIGDIFSINYCDTFKILFIGPQNASLLWCYCNLDEIIEDKNIEKLPRDNLPHLRYNKFFDSKGPGGRINNESKKDLKFMDSISLCELDAKNSIKFAHYGYIYNLLVFTNEFMVLKYSKFEKFLISCGGDGTVNIWGVKSLEKNVDLIKLKSLHNDESILSMFIHNTYLYVGLSNGTINTWDLLTSQLIRSVNSKNEEEISSLVVLDNNGIIYGNKYGLNVISPNNIVVNINKLSTLTLYLSDEKEKGKANLIAGGKNIINYYNILDKGTAPISYQFQVSDMNNDTLLKNLSKFVSFKTVSKFSDFYLHELRNCTKFLVKLFDKYGATSHIIPVEDGNPIIISSFQCEKPKKRILYYGHYDVVEANETNDDWISNPFEMVSKNGFLYGRGVSDNKGPTLSTIQAVAELYQAGELNVDVVFVIEGEEETGSKLFKTKILDHLKYIGEIDYIFSSNSYWLDDRRPCLNYGLRGVVNVSIDIVSEKPDRHSGVDGGVLQEPMMDLIQLLNSFKSSDNEKPIAIEGFYDDVKPISEDELKVFQEIVDYNPEEFNLQELITKWCNPSLTVHKIEVSGPNNNTVIPKTVKSSVSLRIVPNQNIESIKKLLIEHLNKNFKSLNSPNEANFNIFHEAEPWLGDHNSSIYQIAFSKIKENWGIEPLLIREGGSIPIIRFLEKTFDATACQIPCGQSSDNAHLKNERLRIINLLKLKDIFKDILIELG